MGDLPQLEAATGASFCRVDIECCERQHAAMILCIGVTPAAQKVMVFDNLELDAVNRTTSVLDGAAGKSVNVAKVLKALGLKPVAVGFVGGRRGDELQFLLSSRGIATDFVKVDAPTRQCITVIDQALATQTELVEESKPVSPKDYARLLEIIRARLATEQCQAMAISGSLTPDGPVDFYLECVRMAAQAGAFCVVDAQGKALLQALEGRPALVKPNRSELAKTLNRELRNETETLQAIHELRERGAQRIVVTAGPGAVLACDGSNSWRVNVPEVKVVNPIGSGDAFAAGLVWRLLHGDNLGEACRWGCAAGAANALTLMPGEVNPAEIERLVRAVKVEAFGR